MLYGDIVEDLVEFLEGSDMEARVFAVTPVEVWYGVHETGDVDIWWDRSEAWLEKRFLRTHRSGIAK